MRGGYTLIGAVLDEVAFWRTDDGSANPDTEVVSALRPGMATVPDALLLGLSSPYAARGELYKAVERSFGHDDPMVLVWNSDTLSMNPNVPAHIIQRAFEDDPVSAASEYGQERLPPSHTEGGPALEPLGNTFANLPPRLIGYVPRNTLESRLCDSRADIEELAKRHFRTQLRVDSEFLGGLIETAHG